MSACTQRTAESYYPIIFLQLIAGVTSFACALLFPERLLAVPAQDLKEKMRLMSVLL